ncbi:hypothetical protein [Oceanicaulis sp.]|jgi:predicted  nucleic acid-binding Zn-ribbon protein|uniref:hypothetical protein n=1 Tax=Oceanicaulis sp. TaxID=1924941 RepID=UPI000D3FA505
MKTPYKKPSSDKPLLNQIRRPKWAPKQQEEESVCETIRRNIGDDSAEIRRHELSIGQLQEQIRHHEDAIRGLERRRADLNAAEADIPNLPGPDIPNRARGRLGALMRLLQALGHASDALSLMDATSRVLAVTEAQREIARRISNHEDEIERLRRERDQIQGLLDERVAWMRQHFKAFAVHRCHGNAFNSYRFTPSSCTRRLLT